MCSHGENLVFILNSVILLNEHNKGGVIMNLCNLFIPFEEKIELFEGDVILRDDSNGMVVITKPEHVSTLVPLGYTEVEVAC